MSITKSKIKFSCMTSSKFLSMLRLSHLVYKINIMIILLYKFAVKIKVLTHANALDLV